MSSLRNWTLLTIILMVRSASGAEIQDLSKFVQDNANSIVAIDVRQALESPVAKREGWGKKLETAFVDRSIMLPPEADRILISGSLRPDRGFESDSSVAIMQVSRPASLTTIARANGGRLEQVRGTDVVSINDTLVASLDQTTLGVFSPASRQPAARWLGGASAKKGALSPFLTAALAKVSKETPIVLAIDFEDMVSADDAEKALKASGVLKGSPYEPADIAKLLQSAKGLVVEVSLAADAKARVRVEFGQPVKPSAAVMKQIAKAVLEKNGLQLDDVDKLHLNVTGSSFTAESELSKGGLRRLLSLLEVPAPSLGSADKPADTPKTDSSSNVMATKSQAYFKSVSSLLDDLHGDRTKQDPRGGQDAVWMDKYAQKIDRLPVLDVDAEIVDWGTKTAQTLRVMAGTRRDAGLSAGSQKSGLRTGVYWDSYYGGGVTSATFTAKDANQIDTQTGNVATSKRVEGWRLIDNATSDIRKKSTQRYGVEF
jgi:hypothetical protein